MFSASNASSQIAVIETWCNCWRTQLALSAVQVLTLHWETLLSKTLLDENKWFPSFRFLSSCFCICNLYLAWNIHLHLGVTFWQETNLGNKTVLRIWNASDHWRGSSLKKRQTWTHIRRLSDVMFSTSNASSQSHPLHTRESDSFLTCCANIRSYLNSHHLMLDISVPLFLEIVPISRKKHV